MKGHIVAVLFVACVAVAMGQSVVVGVAPEQPGLLVGKREIAEFKAWQAQMKREPVIPDAPAQNSGRFLLTSWPEERGFGIVCALDTWTGKLYLARVGGAQGRVPGHLFFTGWPKEAKANP